MSIKIKSCPFCGTEPTLNHTITLSDGSRELAPSCELKVTWEIKCEKCNIGKTSKKASKYILTNNGEFELVPHAYEDKVIYDAREDVINAWNNRSEDNS